MTVTPLDLTRQKYGRLTAVARLDRDGSGRYRWLFKCDCGNELTTLGTRVKGGAIKSCGCLRRDKITAMNLARGRNPFYRAKRGWLQPHERAQVVDAIRSGTSYVDISIDWLLSPSRVAAIACEEGLACKRSTVT